MSFQFIREVQIDKNTPLLTQIRAKSPESFKFIHTKGPGLRTWTVQGHGDTVLVSCGGDCQNLDRKKLGLFRVDFYVVVEEMRSSESLRAATRVYRNLLKAVRNNIGKEEQKAHFTDFIKREFRVGQPVVDSSVMQQKLNLARDYTFLLNSVYHHKDLLFSYNIAVDRSEEMKKVLGKSAASVGLQLPEAYQP